MKTSGHFKIIPQPKHFDLSNELVFFEPLSLKPIKDEHLPEQGYCLVVKQGEVILSYKDEFGLYYGNQTLEQIKQTTSAAEVLIPLGKIEDWPSIKTRGVMLDISRTKVPSLTTLFKIIDLLSTLRYNHLELYTEHTFAYTNHKEVWEKASPYSAEEILEIKQYCNTKMIELSANQNTLGHMERWLIHERYKNLGIKIGNVMSPYGLMRPATTINPENPNARLLVKELLEELVPLFDSNRVNVGLDEPFEMDPAKHSTWGQYLTFLRDLPILKNKQLLIWSDMLNIHPDLLNNIPENTTVVEWGYEYNSPFKKNLETFSNRAIDHWVAPGTSSWLSITGRFTNCMENIKTAVINAVDFGSSGFLNTDWGDFGHLQWWPISLPGIAIGGELSWAGKDFANSYDISNAKETLNSIIFPELTHSDEITDCLIDMSNVNEQIKQPFPNLGVLALTLYFPQLHVGSGLTTSLTQDEVENCLDSLEQVTSKLSQFHTSDEILQMISGAKLMQIVCLDNIFRLKGTGHIKDVSDNDRMLLSKKLGDTVKEHEILWNKLYRPGGLQESLAWLNHLKAVYDTGAPDPTWSGPLVCLHDPASDTRS